MSQQNIDFGTFPDDPDADAIRTAFQKVQNNFNELYTTATAGSVTSVNQSAGAGIQVNNPTGNVIVTANIACVQVSTSTLSIGQGSNGGTSAIISQTSQTLVIDINPANVFSNNFAANSTGGLANFTGTLTSTSNSQPNITSVGTLTSLAVTGNVTAGNVYANSGAVVATTVTGTLTTAAQPNITSIGTLTSLIVTGNSNLGNVATANIFSGDGGLLTNISVSAGNTIISGSSNSRVVSSGGNVTTSVAGNANILIVTGTGVNVTGYLTSSGDITGANSTANYFIGSGNNLSNIQGANVFGTVANATYASNAGNANTATTATTAGTVTTAAQPNITSVGTLTTLGVSGTVTAAAFTANTGVFTGNGNGLTNLAGANVTGTVANATYAVSAGSATTAGTVTTNAQPNITSVGTLTSVTVTGNTISGNVYANTGTVGAQYLKGDGSNITNISVSAGSTIVNGTSNVSIPAPNGNVNTVVAGNTTVVVTGTGVNITGTLNATSTISGNFSGNLSGNVTTAAQANITSLGTLTGLTVSGTSNLGAVGNVTITGGSSNFYLRTNGSGVLTWSDALLTPIPGSNTQVLFNDAGNANGNSSLTFNKSNGLLTTTTLSATNLIGTLTTASNQQLNINRVGTLDLLIINTAGYISAGSANISAGNINLIAAGSANLGNAASANYFIGNGSLLTGVAASNAVTASTVTTAAQPNITSTGTLTSLAVTGNISAGNVSATTFTGALSGAATTAGTVTTAAQGNITSVGTLTGLGVNGTITGVNITANTGVFTGNGSSLTALNASNVSTGTLAQARLANAAVTLGSTALTLGSTVTTVAGLTSVTSTTFVGALTGAATTAGSATTAGTVTTAAQPNITSVGTLTGLTLSGTLTGAVQIGTGTATHFGTTLTTGANSTAGTITGNWSLSAGSRLNATYADLAEKYVADAEYHPGTVLVFGGNHEVTLSTTSDSFRVAGVVTTNPAYTMNNDCMGKHVVTIALQGRVPVKVIGPVYKGDLLVSCDNGHAIANNIARAGTIIGKSLENFTDASGVIEVAVGRF
jgi:hypothetical protein